MVFLWFSYGFPMVFLWFSIDTQVLTRFPSDLRPLITHNVQELRRGHGPSPQQRQGLATSSTAVAPPKKGCLLGKLP